LQTNDVTSQQPLTGRSVELLQAINNAAATFQRSAHSETAVLQAYQEQMAIMELRGGLSLLDEAGENLVIKVVNYAGRVGAILKKFENLVGIKTKEFTFHPSAVDVYRQVMETRQTQFIADSSHVVAQMLPQSAKRYLGRLIIAFGSDPAIYAPLISAERQVIGVINIVGAGLTAADKPALTAFANQIAVALDNALLFEELQQYATQLENRVAERTQALAEANERLTELDKLKTRLVSNVSHELRTPITTLELYLNLITRGKPEKREHYFQVVEDQVQRLRQLVEGILDLSRLDAGQYQLHAASVQLNDVVSQVVGMVTEQANLKGLALTFRPGEDLPVIQANKSQISQVVVNLLSNSINHTAVGRINVTTYQDRQGKRVFLEVQDTGVGIVPEDRPHIFDRFYRGQMGEEEHMPGTGLGLSIVKEIVEIHKGEISFKSEVGEGSTFWVWLPVSQP
jgi:signal transduction histidine kinase